jgi:hypothetical protein
MQQSSGSYIFTAIVSLGCEEINIDLVYGSFSFNLFTASVKRVFQVVEESGVR